MTSECFVYIALPGETELVTAGRFVREIDRHGVATGRFVYRAKYRARDDAVPLDPLELKLSAKTYETRLLKGVFGALRDASPDHWGRRIIERHFGSPGPDELDYLLDTWHASTRPTQLDPNPPGLKWLGLQVRRHEQHDDNHAIVEFVARNRLHGKAARLHETSRFVREHGRWYYLDGEFAE